MKNLLLLLTLIFAISLFAVEKIDILDNDPFPLTHWLSPEEASRWDEVGRDFYETDPPPEPIHNVAEFEKMEGVLVRYPFGIPVSLIALMSEQTKVVTIVNSTSQQNTVLGQYNSQGVNTDNCEFLIAPSDSYWCRDYGPWYVIDGNGEFGIANFPYNRPRPNDNDIPIEMADFLEINLWGMNVVHTGGNYMTDGLGISASTTLVYDENTITNNEVNQRMLDYLGIQTYFVVDDPNNTYIDHIDCWGKFLDVDKVLIREVPASHAQYDEIEAVAEYFAEQTSSWGNNYQVYRVYTPNDQPYTNSLILNDHVYVPVTGSTWDDDAIASYQEAMPGYTIEPILAGPAAWESTDALHCRTKGIADHNMLYIYHLPLLGDQPADVDLSINAEITAYSGADLIDDEIILHYAVADNEFTDVVMTNSEDNIWTADIPGQPLGSVVHYYITAMDADGNTASHPFIGEYDPHEYYAGGIQEPELEIDPAEYHIVIGADSTITDVLELTNTGGGVINYDLEFMDTTRNISGSYIECSSEYFSPGETIELEFTAYNNSQDSEWIMEASIDFPEGFEVLDATDLEGGSDALAYDSTTGDGAVLTWHGETPSGYGVLQEGQSATCTVEVAVASDFSGNADLNWILTGDEYGEEPHNVNGDIVLEIYGGPVSWISADQLGGDLWAQETDEITLSFCSTNLEDGDYYCNIVVNWEGGEEIIPVILTVLSMPAEENEIPETAVDLVAYPNPFNPETNIRFEVAETGNVKIDIYNARGQKVESLVNDVYDPGIHNITWQAYDQASGVYLLRYLANGIEKQEKLLLLK